MKDELSGYVQAVLELTGVLAGPQLVHQALDLSSCEENKLQHSVRTDVTKHAMERNS